MKIKKSEKIKRDKARKTLDESVQMIIGLNEGLKNRVKHKSIFDTKETMTDDALAFDYDQEIRDRLNPEDVIYGIVMRGFDEKKLSDFIDIDEVDCHKMYCLNPRSVRKQDFLSSNAINERVVRVELILTGIDRGVSIDVYKDYLNAEFPDEKEILVGKIKCGFQDLKTSGKEMIFQRVVNKQYIMSLDESQKFLKEGLMNRVKNKSIEDVKDDVDTNIVLFEEPYNEEQLNYIFKKFFQDTEFGSSHHFLLRFPNPDINFSNWLGVPELCCSQDETFHRVFKHYFAYNSWEIYTYHPIGIEIDFDSDSQHLFYIDFAVPLDEDEYCDYPEHWERLPWNELKDDEQSKIINLLKKIYGVNWYQNSDDWILSNADID